MLVRVVPMSVLIRCNLTHLMGFENRFVRDVEGGVEPIPQWFLRVLLDTGETSYHWFRGFIRKEVSTLPLNEAVFVGFQDKYRDRYAMSMFAVRTSYSRVVVLVYADPKDAKYGIHYTRPLPDRITGKKVSSAWSAEDWACLACMMLDCAFEISSPLVGKKFFS